MPASRTPSKTIAAELRALCGYAGATLVGMGQSPLLKAALGYEDDERALAALFARLRAFNRTRDRDALISAFAIQPELDASAKRWVAINKRDLPYDIEGLKGRRSLFRDLHGKIAALLKCCP